MAGVPAEAQFITETPPDAVALTPEQRQFFEENLDVIKRILLQIEANAATGVTGPATFTTVDGKTVTVTGGLITEIV